MTNKLSSENKTRISVSFCWKEVLGRLWPICVTNNKDEIDATLFEGFFTDDGGHNLDSTISNLKYLLSEIDEILSGNEQEIEECSEIYCVYLNKYSAKFYDYFDGKKYFMCPISEFRKILAAWVDFISSKPDPVSEYNCELYI